MQWSHHTLTIHKTYKIGNHRSCQGLSKPRVPWTHFNKKLSTPVTVELQTTLVGIIWCSQNRAQETYLVPNPTEWSMCKLALLQVNINLKIKQEDPIWIRSQNLPWCHLAKIWVINFQQIIIQMFKISPRSQGPRNRFFKTKIESLRLSTVCNILTVLSSLSRL